MPFFRPTLFFRTTLLLLGPLSALGAFSEVDNLFSWVLPLLYENNSCYKDLTEMLHGLFQHEQWALNMLDAVGKPEANARDGIDGGMVGSYQQCVGIKHRWIEGQHCWFHNFGNRILGICLPNSCRNQDLQPLSIDCHYNDIQLTMTSYVAIGICCVLLFCVVVGTFKDCVKRSTIRHQFIGLEVFSLLSNARSLFSVEQQRRGAFPELNCLKAITMALVIFVHSYTTLLLIIKNRNDYLKAFHQWYGQLLLQNYPISIFFLCTGFLTLYSILRRPPQRNKRRFLFNYVVNRYLKLLVAPASIVLIFRLTLLPISSSGPFWRTIPEWHCGKKWWKNVLFISNWWPIGQQCFMAWWFLSATMQMHLLSLVVIVPLIYHRYRMCVLNGSALLVFSWCWLAWKDILLPLYPQGDDINQSWKHLNKYRYYNDHIYQTPILHLSAYLLGMGLAWVLFTHKDGISLNKVSLAHSIGCSLDDKQVFCGWGVFSLLLYLTLYGVYLRPNRMLRRVHNVFASTMHSVTMVWVILFCYVTGNNGVMRSVMRWKYWLPLSKLNFCVYLLHQNVVDFYYLSEVDKISFTFPSLCVFFVRHWLLTYPLAIVAALSIEMPLNAIVDAIFK